MMTIMTETYAPTACEQCGATFAWQGGDYSYGPECGFCGAYYFDTGDDRYDHQWYDQTFCDCDDGVRNGDICGECGGVGLWGYSW
jgi:hypothetical protein